MSTIEEIKKQFGSWGKSYFMIAYAVAEKVHCNDKRWGGNPYMDHIDAVIVGAYERVKDSINLGTVDEILSVAALHDAIEDHPEEEYSISRLYSDFGVTNSGTRNILSGIQAMTKPKDIPYAQYIKQVMDHDYACIVKLADLEDNLKDLPPGPRRDKYELAKLCIHTRGTTL